MLYSPPVVVSSAVPPFHSRWITGLQLSANTDSTQYDRTGGEIELFNGSDRNNPLWSRATIVAETRSFPTLLTTNKIVYVYLDAEGTDKYQIAPPCTAELADRIYLGELRTEDNATISEIIPYIIDGDPATLQLVSDRLIKNPYNLRPAPVNGTLQLSFPAGEIEAAGRNHFYDSQRPHKVAIPAQSPITFDVVTPSNVVVEAGQTDLQFDRYWNGSNFTSFNQSNDSTVKFLYLDARGKFFLVPGTERYNSLNVAKNRWAEVEVHIAPDLLKYNALLVAVILGESRATNTNSNRVVILSN